MKNLLFLIFFLLSISCASLPWRGPYAVDTSTLAPTVTFERTATPRIPSLTPTPPSTPTLSEEARRGEEYAIYDSILEQFFVHGRIQCIVLEDHTTLGFFSFEDEKGMEYLRENLPEASEDLFADFMLQNQESVLLEQNFKVDVPVILISEEEISEFFSEGGGGWEAFYKTYEGSQGIMELSRAGFNEEMDLALVYAGNQSDYLAGAGYLLVMEKQDGVWSTLNSLMVWIS